MGKCCMILYKIVLKMILIHIIMFYSLKNLMLWKMNFWKSKKHLILIDYNGEMKELLTEYGKKYKAILWI